MNTFGTLGNKYAQQFFPLLESDSQIQYIFIKVYPLYLFLVPSDVACIAIKFDAISKSRNIGQVNTSVENYSNPFLPDCKTTF